MKTGCKHRLSVMSGILLMLCCAPLCAGKLVVPADLAELPAIKPGMGYLLLDMDVGRPVSAVTFVDSKLMDSVEKAKGKTRRAIAEKRARQAELDLGAFAGGRVLTLVPVPVGDYQWRTVSSPHYDLPYRLRLGGDERWRFSIKAGAINYVGRITVEKDRGTDYFQVRLRNRLADSLPEIEQQLAVQLAQYPLVYSGHMRDDFLKEYEKLKKEPGQ